MKRLGAKLALTVVFPVLIFVLLETGLRLGGFGQNTDFFIPDEQPGVYRTNPHFTELFFSASFGLKPVNFRLSREKPPGSYRIFVIGESAAMGVPEPAFSLAPQLQAQLRAAEPERAIEVFNLGVTAINSHAILRIVQSAVKFHPDLLVIYMGNNEVVGPYGPGSVFSDRVPPRSLIRFGLWLRSIRTGQLIQRLLSVLRSPGSNAKDWRGMEMFTHAKVSATDPQLAATYANFTANLNEILTLARDAGAKVILSTVAVNVRNCAPFVSQHPTGMAPGQIDAWQQSVTLAERALDREDFDTAKQKLQAALTIDPTYADTHFRLARALDATGELVAARAHYAEALQLDELRFRTDAQINDLIRRAVHSNQQAITLVDASKEFGSEAGSPTTPPAGANLFFEHVHFRWDGNYALARLIAPAAWAALHGKDAATAAWLDPQACADALGYTRFAHLAMAQSMAELTGRPPFTGQSSYAEDRARLLAEISAEQAALSVPGEVRAAVAKSDAALRRDPKNPRLLFQAASVRLQTRDFEYALELNGRLQAEQPPAPELAVQRAFLLQQLGRKNEAEELLLHTAERSPFYFQTYGLLAQLWISTNQSRKALEYFAKLTDRMPDVRGARACYAQLLARGGDEIAAERQLREILKLVPDDESALAPLVKRLEQSGKTEEAQKMALAAFAYNPRSYDNNVRLVEMYESQGDSEKMVLYLSALAASGPVNGRLYFDLAEHLKKLGRREEMRAALVRAKQILRTENDPVVSKKVEDLMRDDHH